MIRSRLHPGIRNEEGLVSFLIVSVIIALLALVTVGFSRIMGREVRQALDRELATQAYYSAESGINDARAYLANGGGNLTSCVPPASPYFVDNGDISGDGIAKYSCVVTNSTPKELIYDLKEGQSLVFKLSKDLSMSKLYFGWENKLYNDSANPQPLGANVGDLPREDTLPTDATGLLKVELYPASGTSNNANLSTASRNYFMYPNSGSGVPGGVNYGSNGSFVPGNCNRNRILPTSYQSTPRYCNSSITVLNGNANANSYYVRLSAKYKPLSVSVLAANGLNEAQPIPSVEGVIDVTGTGNDVLKRLRVRVCLGNNCQPSFDSQSMVSICKLFRVPVLSLNTYGSTYVDGNLDSDGACAKP